VDLTQAGWRKRLMPNKRHQPFLCKEVVSRQLHLHLRRSAAQVQVAAISNSISFGMNG